MFLLFNCCSILLLCVPGVVLNPLPLCNLYTCISWCVVVAVAVVVAVVVVSVPYYLVHCSLFTVPVLLLLFHDYTNYCMSGVDPRCLS